MDISIDQIGARAKAASRTLATLDSRTKVEALSLLAETLLRRSPEIMAANERDTSSARESGLKKALIDRLTLDEARISGMAQGVRAIASLPDPIGTVLSAFERPNGLRIEKVRVPLGVIAIIYESRPNVTIEAASICFKSSNAVILKGGREALHTNVVLGAIMQEVLEHAGAPRDAVQVVPSIDRNAVQELVQLEGKVDLVIPRGGEGLIRAVTEMARVPVIKHYKGVCHVFVDESADPAMALRIIENAKCQRPGVCNAVETVLVHERCAAEIVPKLAALLSEKGVELRGDDTCQALSSHFRVASVEDWDAEYLDLVLAVRVVPDLDGAIEHIATHGSQHTDAIVTRNDSSAECFLAGVDSSVVMVNASTRFNDGGEFGMGAEIGISTDKIHARGPMGLEELTTYKYLVRGSGQTRV